MHYPKDSGFDALKSDMEGRWGYLFEELAPELGDAMASPAKHVPCPVHGGTDGFRLFPDYLTTGGGACNSCGRFRGGFQTLAWVRGYTTKDATREVQRWLRGEASRPTTELRAPQKQEIPKTDPKVAYRRIREVWLRTRSIKQTAVHRYLHRRGLPLKTIQGAAQALRIHPGLKYFAGKTKECLGIFPCMVAPVTSPDGRILSIHRTYLTAVGMKAPVPKSKKMMAYVEPLAGSAIRLFPAEETLGLAEGIETALSAHAGTGMPVWSCVSTAMLEAVELPDYVRHVVIWADLDRNEAGLNSAIKLRKRLLEEGRSVDIVFPQVELGEDEKGVDWNDVLDRFGQQGLFEQYKKALNHQPPILEKSEA